MNHFQQVSFVLCILFLQTALAVQGTYKITKHVLGDSHLLDLGKLVLVDEGQFTHAYLETTTPVFIGQTDVKNHNTVILTFTEQSTQVTFKAAVNSILSTPHSEKIVVVLSATQQVMAINYSQNRLPNQDISASVDAPDRGAQYIFKTEPQIKPNQQEETFFQKYKWPLIIGGVLLYMSMTTTDPEKGQGGAGPARQ